MDQPSEAPTSLTCFGCGITNAEDACTFAPSFLPQHCDYTPASLRLARQLVTEGEVKLAGIERAIERLRSHWKSLRWTVAQYKMLLAPISRLPDDILLLIFSSLVESAPNRRSQGSLWRITAICRRWRLVALSCSALWTNIQLNLKSNVPTKRILQQCSRAQLQLLRAGPQIPLAYTLHFSTHDHMQRFWEDSSLPRIESTIHRLMADLHRCSRIDVSGDGPESWPDGWDILRDAIPLFDMLHTLKISGDFWFTTGFFEQSPVLENLTLHRVEFFPALPYHWRQVRFLELGQCEGTAGDLIEMLRATRQLATLILRPTKGFEHEADTTVPSDTEPVHLPSLRTLDISLPPSTGQVHIVHDALRYLRAPVLAALHLNYPDRQGLDIIGSLLDASDNPSSLQHLSFCNPWHWTNTLRALPAMLSRIPSLISIHVQGPKGGHDHHNFDRLVEALTWSASAEEESTQLRSGNICPHLEEVSLLNLTVKPQLLQRMVESRVLDDERRPLAERPPARLRVVKLARMQFPEGRAYASSQIEWLEDLERQKLVNIS